MATGKPVSGLKPILLYDHLPGILAGYPAVLFAILGLLEFIDWGGGDILFYASRYMREATGEDRFAAPQIVKDNMAEGRNGLRDKAGFLDYENMDIPDYQRARLEAFAAMLKHMDKLPKPGGANQ